MIDLTAGVEVAIVGVAVEVGASVGTAVGAVVGIAVATGVADADGETVEIIGVCNDVGFAV